MAQIIFLTLISVVIISAMSLVGALTLILSNTRMYKILTLLVSLSAGSLLGGAFLHLLPEAAEEGFTLQVSLSIIGGILLFFIIEKFVHWRHCHHAPNEKNHHHHLAIMNLVGDGVHNFLDGVIVAISYMASIPAGIATTIAVVLHEVPQEISDFGVLLYAGWSKWKALLFNFLSAAIAVIGAIVALTIGSSSEKIILWILPLAAGGFIYIAGSDLIPELHRECHTKENFWKASALNFFMMLVGIGLMWVLTLLE